MPLSERETPDVEEDLRKAGCRTDSKDHHARRGLRQGKRHDLCRRCDFKLIEGTQIAGSIDDIKGTQINVKH